MTTPPGSTFVSEEAIWKAFDDLIERVVDYAPAIDVERLRQALRRSLSAGPVRVTPSTLPGTADGAPVAATVNDFAPLGIAYILAGLRMDAPTLQAALLHGVAEPTVESRDKITSQFGSEVASLVDGVVRLSALSGAAGAQAYEGGGREWGRATVQTENLRKIFLATARDVRVILLKLAERLHQLRTMGNAPHATQKAVANETLEILTPLAQRLGLGKLYPEMEDLAFKYLHPEEASRLEEELRRVREDREKVIPVVLETLSRKMAEFGLRARIDWRSKHAYSVWRKMVRDHKTLDEIWDLFAVRLTVDEVQDCYTALGAVNTVWQPFKDRIKDYIMTPKSNRYQSLHTTVVGPSEQPLEVQIRTTTMQENNDFGVAAHWAYKQGRERGGSLAQDIYPWIKALLDMQSDSTDTRKYQNLQLDLLTNEVFVFTPRGDVVDLPAGSTPIDFAYRVHTDVGHRCVGAKVNAKMVPLGYRLRNADIVDIVTQKHGTPSLDWLRVCKSTHARNKIRAWFKKERREENIARGKAALERGLRRVRASLAVMSDHDLLMKIAVACNFVTVDDLLAAVGYSEISVTQLLTRLREIDPSRFPKQAQRQTAQPRRSPDHAVRASGTDNLLVRLSKCCNPVWGDEIIGYVSQGRGVIVHRTTCRSAASRLRDAPERRMQVSWEASSAGALFPVTLQVVSSNRDGLLVDLMGIVNDARVPSRRCNATTHRDLATIELALDIVHRQQLDDLIKRLLRVQGVVAVSRI